VAITQAQLAKQLANGQRDVTKTDWYKSIVKAVQAKGAQAMREAEWYDAYRAWSGLKDLQPDSETYRTKAKTAARHVRVLQLYGQKEDPNVADDEDVTTWRDRVKGIDGRMVEGAISQVSRAYVTNVDYLSLTLGGLRSIKILAETPQAAESFPGLKNEKDKAKFIDSIDRAMEQFKNRTRMDNLCLQLAMNKVLLASEETVEIPTEVLAMEFTDGFLEELDQFSSMIWPYDVEEFNKQTMGKFVGVGIQITKSPGEPLRVVTPLVGSPAYKAGVKTDDVILKVDGVETTPLDINKLVRRITGKEGSIVTLTIKRQGLPKPIDIDIKREQIHIRTVKGWKRLDDGEWSYVLDPDWGIGYIRLTQFTRKSAEHMETALKELRSKGVENLVLDLRFNPGGLLGSARDIASEFLDSGTVVSTSGRQTRKTVLSALSSGSFEEGKLIVLVNEYSASAAEIVSGALQDWKRATIVGSRTYGKGSVQHVIDLGDDRAFLKLTTAYYYLPSNRLLHRRPGAKTWGVDPDVSVYISPRQTRRWLDIRRTTDLVQDELDSSQLDKDLKEQFNADVQLKTAVLLLKLQKLHDNQGVKTASSGS
jgi:carboxyl-terminal processing protease